MVGSLIEPAQIANDHIRIHALEGQLFRSIVKDAAPRSAAAGVPGLARTDLYGFAEKSAEALGRRLRQRVTEFGRGVTGPWRAEHKAASVAAWLVIAK